MEKNKAAREAAIEAIKILNTHNGTGVSYDAQVQIIENVYLAGAASVSRREVGDLLQERIQDHSDHEHSEYNGCDDDPCNWCERAKLVIADIQEAQK